MREALGMIGGDCSGHMPPPLSNLKLVPLSPPKCLEEVSQHLANSSAPFVGLQVLIQFKYVVASKIKLAAFSPTKKSGFPARSRSQMVLGRSARPAPKLPSAVDPRRSRERRKGMIQRACQRPISTKKCKTWHVKFISMDLVVTTSLDSVWFTFQFNKQLVKLSSKDKTYILFHRSMRGTPWRASQPMRDHNRTESTGEPTVTLYSARSPILRVWNLMCW